MLMKWVGMKRETPFVDVEQLPWNSTKLKEGDLVYIAGNLEHGFPTALYGRHIVTDKLMHKLTNKEGTEFYENWPFLYKEIK